MGLTGCSCQDSEKNLITHFPSSFALLADCNCGASERFAGISTTSVFVLVIELSFVWLVFLRDVKLPRRFFAEALVYVHSWAAGGP